MLLDTQIFIALSYVGLDDFSSRARKLIENEDSELLFSAVSITEIVVKASINKLAITAGDASKTAEDLRLTLIPFEPRHAMRMFQLPVHHRDPFDQMLIATALSESVPIISQDSEFKSYRGLKLIWQTVDIDCASSPGQGGGVRGRGTRIPAQRRTRGSEADEGS